MVISVVIPTRNRAPQLKRMLDVLLEDDYCDKEIIVCDGASTDETVELLKSYGAQIRWISEPDRGEFDARNKGLAMATGELIKYMSDDDILVPGSFTYAAQYFDEHRETDILFGQSIWFDGRRGRQPFVCDTRKRDADSITLKNLIRCSKLFPNSESVFFRRRVIDRIGLFDYTIDGADFDYWALAAKVGLKLDICDRVIVHYYLTDLSGIERRTIPFVLSAFGRARRHGDWTDQLYFIFVQLPYRLALVGLIKYLPFVFVPIRDAWGRRKASGTVV